jgi:methylated-DNA-[protein]-cysteine S-methyltransferase
MVFWTFVNGRLLGGERLGVYLAARDGVIVSVSMDAEGHSCTEDEFLWRCEKNCGAEHWPEGTGSGLLDAAAMQVEDYMAGRQLTFDLPLQHQGTPFQTEVWKALTRIPFGETRTYGEVAKMIGNPSAVRAVGQANRRNHLPLIVPCHRVTGASGKIGGFDGGTDGGVQLKRALLAHETAVLQRRSRLKATA